MKTFHTFKISQSPYFSDFDTDFISDSDFNSAKLEYDLGMT